ncbi:Leukocyte surface antigen CD53 [Merluccius polli]|uniref:Tetraspanin n=1 Tax=Merluccius polli TaxID=89951 RepID=A0AA47P137_MERPO|nr:Leukocyte surface antigen CD53 [Merluccius polli]
MAQNCLKCLKYIMCAVNFLCFMSGVAVLILGVYMICYQTSALFPSRGITVANLLLIAGVIITCIAFLGFIGALKENRCFLLTFFILLLILMLMELAAACLLLFYDKEELEKELTQSLKETIKKSKVSNDTNSDWDMIQQMFDCCGVGNLSDWNYTVPASCCKGAKCSPQPQYQKVALGCLDVVSGWFEENFLLAGIAVIVLCVIEVLGMCFSMTLFCHISRSGLSYKI